MSVHQKDKTVGRTMITLIALIVITISILPYFTNPAIKKIGRNTAWRTISQNHYTVFCDGQITRPGDWIEDEVYSSLPNTSALDSLLLKLPKSSMKNLDPEKPLTWPTGYILKTSNGETGFNIFFSIDNRIAGSYYPQHCQAIVPDSIFMVRSGPRPTVWGAYKNGRQIPLEIVETEMYVKERPDSVLLY